MFKTFQSAVRRYIFWTLDFLRGQPIRKPYLTIKGIMDGKIEVGEFQKHQIDELLLYAKQNVPYYSSCTMNNIDEFPVIDKNIIKEHYDEFQSEEFKNLNLHIKSTSGSTGTPLHVRQNQRKRNQVLAELIYFDEKLGQKVGDKFAFLRVWTKWDTASKFTFWKKNEVPIDIASLSDENMEKVRHTLRTDKDINKIMGYASTLKQLLKYAKYCGDNSSDYHLKAILSGSEMMEPYVREELKEVFGCTVVSRYSNQENGVLAQQCPGSEEYHLNDASYYVELLKLDSDEPAEKGQVGRVVVTDLFNYAMPMIRYDTGDLAIEGECPACEWNTRILQNIQGRRVHACYDTKGNMVSPFLLDKHMEQFSELKQFQFIQEEEKDYVLKVNGATGKYTDEQFITILKSFLGDDSNIQIVHVDEIPVVASGKYMQMICNYKK